MSRSTKSRGLTYYISYLFLLCVFLLIAVFGGMYIINILCTVFAHSTGIGCGKNSHKIHVAYEQITVWNWIVVCLIGFALYKIKEHL